MQNTAIRKEEKVSYYIEKFISQLSMMQFSNRRGKTHPPFHISGLLEQTLLNFHKT